MDRLDWLERSREWLVVSRSDTSIHLLIQGIRTYPNQTIHSQPIDRLWIDRSTASIPSIYWINGIVNGLMYHWIVLVWWFTSWNSNPNLTWNSKPSWINRSTVWSDWRIIGYFVTRNTKLSNPLNQRNRRSRSVDIPLIYYSLAFAVIKSDVNLSINFTNFSWVVGEITFSSRIILNIFGSISFSKFASKERISFIWILSKYPFVAAKITTTCFSTGIGVYWPCFSTSVSLDPLFNKYCVEASRSEPNWAKAATSLY